MHSQSLVIDEMGIGGRKIEDAENSQEFWMKTQSETKIII